MLESPVCFKTLRYNVTTLKFIIVLPAAMPTPCAAIGILPVKKSKNYTIFIGSYINKTKIIQEF